MPLTAHLYTLWVIWVLGNFFNSIASGILTFEYKIQIETFFTSFDYKKDPKEIKYELCRLMDGLSSKLNLEKYQSVEKW